MMHFLIHGGYAGILTLHATLLVILLAWRVRELREARPKRARRSTDGAQGAWPSTSRAGKTLEDAAVLRWNAAVLMAAAIAVLAFACRSMVTPAPQVWFDEFYYLGTAHHIATAGILTPLVYHGLPPTPLTTPDVLPPYPQGWPCLLAPVLRVVGTSTGSFATAVGVQRVLGVVTVLAVFGMLVGESVPAAAFAAGALAVMPVLIRLGAGASAETSALLFVVLALWACRSQRFRPSPAGALLAAAALAWMVHFRPENVLYLALFVPVAFVTAVGRTAAQPVSGRPLRPYYVGISLMLLAVLVIPDLSIMHDAARHGASNFQAIPRPGFASVTENTVANVGNNLRFFVDGRILPLWVVPLALLGTGMVWRRGWRVGAAFYWAWAGLFVVALSPFPFGDFAAAHSVDTWRFSPHVTLPLVLLGARGVEWAWRSLGTPGRALGTVVVAAAVLMTPWTNHGFIWGRHPMEPLWRGAAEATRLMADGTAVVADRDVALLLQEGVGQRTTLAPVTEAAARATAVREPLYFCEQEGGIPSGWAHFPLRSVLIFGATAPTGQRVHLSIWAWVK